MISNFLSSMLQHGTLNLANRGGVHLTLAVKKKKSQRQWCVIRSIGETAKADRTVGRARKVKAQLSILKLLPTLAFERVWFGSRLKFGTVLSHR